LVIPEPGSQRCLPVAANDPEISVWWGTPIEIASALSRRYRDGSLNVVEFAAARREADRLLQRSNEIAPSEQIRTSAMQLVRQHPLRAADAAQLAAAMFAFGPSPTVVEFVSMDERLRAAALAEGAIVYP